MGDADYPLPDEIYDERSDAAERRKQHPPAIWVMIAGPYRAGAPTPEEQAANLRRLNSAALAIHEVGYIPIIGVNMALPIIEAAGGSHMDYRNVMMPLSLALSERCDVCLRLPGLSNGADAEVRRFEELGRPVFYNLQDVLAHAARSRAPPSL